MEHGVIQECMYCVIAETPVLISGLMIVTFLSNKHSLIIFYFIFVHCPLSWPALAHLCAVEEGAPSSEQIYICHRRAWSAELLLDFSSACPFRQALTQCLRTAVPPYLWFHFSWFQLPMVNFSPKILNGKIPEIHNS